MTDEEVDKSAAEALANTVVKVNEKKGNITGALFFISSVQAENLAKLAASGEKDKKVYKNLLKRKYL